MFCKNCGKEVVDEAIVCPYCGVSTNGEIKTQQQPPVNVSVNVSNGVMDTSPVSTGAFFGYLFLFGIPVVGFIIYIIFACGGTRNVNLRNYARAQLLWMVVVIAFIIFLYFVCGISLLAMVSNARR